MKKISLIAVLLLSFLAADAQHQINSFFDMKGAVQFETTELDEAADTLVSIFHRRDDVVYSRIVYRVIDMRYRQNYQLYFPTNPDEPKYKSLFRTILWAITQGLPIYEKSTETGDIKPNLWEEPLDVAEIPGMLNTDQEGNGTGDIATDDYMLIHYDSTTNEITFNNYAYPAFARNQLKYLIQEIVFFDKHYSRLYSKIIAIAPLQSDKIQYYEDMPLMEAMYQSILFWISFDDLRPYMARQYIIPEANDSRRVTFDEFFAKKLYTSYLIGDSNMFDRMIGDYTADEKEIKKEQARIESELLNFEQDLWEY